MGSQRLELVLDLVSPAGRRVHFADPLLTPPAILGPGLEPLKTDVLACGLEGSG